ncbi:MAG: hypothetical protein WA631_17355 [Nitrososphaeraceae archaeon]
MPTKLSTTDPRIGYLPNSTNTTIIEVFHEYMKDNESSERHQHNVLNGVIAYAKFLGSDDTIYEIRHKD